MLTMKDLLPTEKPAYRVIRKMGYTQEEALAQIENMRKIPKEDREELTEIIRKNMIRENYRVVEDYNED